MKIPYSEACERNKGPILDVLNQYFDQANTVVEVGSGTAQHAVFFAEAKPHLRWQTSDQQPYLDGINAQLAVAKLSNVISPIMLDVNQEVWVENGALFDLVFTANTLHIMSESDVEAFFAGLQQLMTDQARLVVYGPFKYSGRFTSDSNQAFDLSLRSRGVGSGIRDFEWVNRLAEQQGLYLLEDHKMPANNQCLIWSRGDLKA